MRTARDDLVLEMPSFGNSDITFFPLAILIQTFFHALLHVLFYHCGDFQLNPMRARDFMRAGKCWKTRFVPRSASSSLLIYKNSYQMFGTLTTREEY